MKRILLFVLLLLSVSQVARAGGGPCPSGANYLYPGGDNQSVSPANPFVTLAALGVSSCYFIADSGSDSNTGTDEAHPFLHAPLMVNCTANCATVNPVAGEGFIFKGGDTWHVFSGSPQMGLPGGSQPFWIWNWTVSGTAAHPIYIGVDPAWFSGSSWSRPIINSDNPVVGAPGIVSSCAFTQGDHTDVQLNSVTHVFFDNFEFTGLCWDDMPNNTNTHAYLGQQDSVTSFRVISNNYFHGWTHTPFHCSPTGGTVCGTADGIRGATHTTVIGQGTQIVFNVCDGWDSDDTTFYCADGDNYIFAYNVVRHNMGNGVLDNCHSIHDNLFEYINNTSDNYMHTDMEFCVGESDEDNFFYNNLVRFVATEHPGGGLMSTIFWFNPTDPTKSDYIFNNVGHDVNCGGNCNNIEPGSTGHMFVYNNTWESMNKLAIWAMAANAVAHFTDANNHYITNNGSSCAAVFGKPANVNGGGVCPDVFQTIAAANAQGYTSANDYAPTTAGNTVGKATNQSAMGAVFGAAFLQSTTGACSYNAASHTPVCPGIGVVNRPSTGAWDAGAYVSSSSADQPPAPSNLTATVSN